MIAGQDRDLASLRSTGGPAVMGGGTGRDGGDGPLWGGRAVMGEVAMMGGTSRDGGDRL